MQIIKQLDLEGYIKDFEKFLVRPKPFFIEGDTHIAYDLIKELSKATTLKNMPCVINLDRAIALLPKSATLHISELHAFVQIIRYFLYIKGVIKEGKLHKWLSKIVIPNDLQKICDWFDDKGNFKNEIDEEFISIERSLHMIKGEISGLLHKILSTARVQPYLVDRSIHYLNDQEALLLRGGFNHVTKGNIIGRSAGGFFYVVPKSLAKLNAKQSDLLDRKEELIYKYCKELSALFKENLFFLKFINRQFDILDSYLARVQFASAKNLSFVLPTKNQKIVLKNFKHYAIKDPKGVDIDFSRQVLMITGVNAGGKTMLLKSIISAVFCAKYLLPMSIDAHHSYIGSFKNLHAIIDDPQSVKNDISTFAGRMKQFGKLFATKEAIVGIDEIELGTDADEAASLYKVLIERLIEQKTKIIVTTHHKRLASLLATNEEVELLAALYDEERRAPVYEYLKGTIGKSYAFETALRYGISEALIKDAKELYGEDKENLNDLIEKNINLEIELKTKNRALDEELLKQQKLTNVLKTQKERQNAEFSKLKTSLAHEYGSAIHAAKEAIKSKTSKEAHKALNTAHQQKQKIKTQTPKASDEALHVGDAVRYGNTKGTIKSLKNKKAIIEANGITLSVPTNTLHKYELTHAKKTKKIKIKAEKKHVTSGVVLDLHGLRSEEAIEKLDKFISDGLIAGYDEIKIYHGIGTGKLAHAVREFLKSHPNIQEWRDAHANEGGYGATIVTL